MQRMNPKIMQSNRRADYVNRLLRDRCDCAVTAADLKIRTQDLDERI